MKHHLRKQMKALLAAMTPDEVASQSQAACEKLIALDEYQQARAIMLYLPTPQEVDTAEIALHAWQHGKTVLAPKVNRQQRHMLAMEIHSFDDGLVTGSFGLREPHDNATVWPSEEIDLIIVPALAYDVTGGRLGRGGGFYDRFLSEPCVSAVTCGLGFAEQLVDELPLHSHDWPVDLLVTDREVRRFNATDKN